MKLRCINSLSVLVIAAFVAGCNASYGDKVGYLEEVAQRGVEVHKLIEDLEGEAADEEQCAESSRLLNTDLPRVDPDEREDWENLVEGVFVSACVSGRY